MLIGDFCRITSHEVTGQQVTAVVALNAGDPVFEGHFPGQPIVPGVYLMQLVKELLSKAVEAPLQLSDARQVKFLQAVDPGTMQQLHVHMDYTYTEEGKLGATCVIRHEDTVCLKLSAKYIQLS